MATKPKTLDDFMNDNDRDTITRRKIRAAFEAMLKVGPHEHDAELEFARRSGVNQTELSRFRDEFSKHIAFVPKLMGRKSRFVWFASPKVVPEKFRWTPEKIDG